MCIRDSSAWVSSYSFSSLAEKLLDEYGGAAVRTVTDAARVVLVRRAVEALGPRVTYYGRHRRSPVFLQKCAETLNAVSYTHLLLPDRSRIWMHKESRRCTWAVCVRRFFYGAA